MKKNGGEKCNESASDWCDARINLSDRDKIDECIKQHKKDCKNK